MANFDKEKIIGEIEKATNGKMDIESIKKAANEKDAQALLKTLSNEDKNKILKLLNDKESLNALLKNPRVNDMFNKFMNGREN